MPSLKLAALALAALCALRATPAAAADPVGELFGSRVSAAPGFKAPVAQGDFDGGGLPGSVYMVRVAAASPKKAFAPDVRVVDKALGDTPIGDKAAPLALAIVQGGGRGKFLVTGDLGETRGFFDTPIWTVSPPPLHVARRGSREWAGFRKGAPAIRYDVLVVGTEAGIDMALYWNGRTYALFAPEEEP